uniref:DUF4328 domain-containing protein n=1 Tax=Caenorhabditis tropicalis TaxID=1561998 RepID=A0A1I7UJF2_9PELO
MTDTSIRSTNSNISRGGRPESGRLHRKYPYRWLFDQVHVKSLIFHVEVGLLAGAVLGLYQASQMGPEEHFDPIPVPGFDGLPLTGETHRNYNGVLLRPNYMIARNIINAYSYFLIFSVITGFLGMNLSETSHNRRNFPADVNPAHLLVPSSISVITFMYPLLVWSLRTLLATIRLLIKDNFKFSVVLDSCRLTFVPIILIWTIYIYFLYGFWLGVLYYQRRGDQPSPTSNNGVNGNLLSDLTTVTEISAASSATPTSHCVLSIPSSSSSSTPSTPPTTCVKLANRSVSSPRGYHHLETVDEEAQSRSSSD